MTSGYQPLTSSGDEDAVDGVGAEATTATAGGADGTHESFVNSAFFSLEEANAQPIVGDDETTSTKRERLKLKDRLRRRRDEPSQELTEEERAELEEEFREELSYYVTQVYDLVRPIIITFAFTVWFVQTVFATTDVSQISPINISQESADDGGWSRFGAALENALFMIGAIVVVTFLFVCLFYFRLTIVLYAWLALSVTTTLGGLGTTVIYSMCQAYNITVDMLSLAIFLWNFAAVGILSIMWSSPLYIQQGYLVLISALLATNFTFLPEWTAWVFLAVISIYDLLAVLCPGGPLKMLVELSQKRNERIPALLYSAGMADHSDATQGAKLAFTTSGRSSQRGGQIRLEDDEDDNNDNDGPDGIALSAPLHGDGRSTDALLESHPLVEMNAQGEAIQTTEQAAAEAAALGDTGQPGDDEPRGVQLGLGDFIFYSVLVARAALTNWLTLMACALATLTGLCLTLLLLAIYRRALPALPISIAFGMICYFTASNVLTPYMNTFALHGVVV